MFEPHVILFTLSAICLIWLVYCVKRLRTDDYPCDALQGGVACSFVFLVIFLMVGFLAYFHNIPYSKIKEDLAIQLVNKGCSFKSSQRFAQQKHLVYTKGPEDEEVLLTGYFPNLDKHVEQKELEVKMQKIKQILKD